MDQSYFTGPGTGVNYIENIYSTEDNFQVTFLKQTLKIKKNVWMKSVQFWKGLSFLFQTVYRF